MGIRILVVEDETEIADFLLRGLREAGDIVEPAEHSMIFEPFYRSLEARKVTLGGIGLGLAISKRILRALGGALDVSSEPG
jgi:signal transduction histidine kinase